MTWSTLNPAALALHLDRDAAGGWPAWREPACLGSATAGAWSWAPTPARVCDAPPAGSSPSGSRLRAPTSILQRMADAARALGRDESDIWVEAAREWLIRHEPSLPGGGYGRAEAGASATPAYTMRRSRVWRDIDGVLGLLRADDASIGPVSA